MYGSHSLSSLVARHPETKDGLTRFLYEIILRRGMSTVPILAALQLATTASSEDGSCFQAALHTL